MALFTAKFYTMATTTGTHDVNGTTTTTAVLIPLLPVSE